MTAEGLEGRTAIVTGGSQGIGKACAESLLRAGAEVMVCARREARVAEAKRELSAHGPVRGYAADVSERGSAEALVEETVRAFGPPDILVACHGVIGPGAPFLETTPEDWETVLGVNLMGVVNVCQAAARHMAERGSGVIVTVSSTSGFVADEHLSPYDVSKAGVAQLTRCMARDLWPLGIRVNGVAPGWVHTEMAEPWLAQAEGRELATNMTGAAGRPEDIAQVVTFLCSPAARFVVGANVPVDGGSLAMQAPFMFRDGSSARGEQANSHSVPPVSDDDGLERLSSEELYHLAVSHARRHLDARFFWELLQVLPAAEAAAGELEEAEADVMRLSAHIDDLVDAGRAPIADMLRPFYLEYLRKHDVRPG